MWDLLLSAGASLLGGYLQGQGAAAGGDAAADAARESAALQRQVYLDQRGLAAPSYMTGGAATNKLAALYGIAPQDYGAALRGANNFGMGGGYNPSDYGAGAPVQGHTGGGGRNPLMPFVRDGGDNWQTLGTSAPGGFDYDAYWNNNTDLQTATNGWNKPDVQSLFNGNRDAYLWWHYNTFGKGEGRTLDPVGGSSGGNTQTPTPTGDFDLEDYESRVNAATDPMAEFIASPHNKLATEMTDIDFGKIRGQLGASGKSISGAGEKRYAKTLAGNRTGAFNDYTNALRSLAGMQQTAGSQISGAAGQYGANAGNALMRAGEARGNALSSMYAGIGQGVSGAVGAVQDYGKREWGWG